MGSLTPEYAAWSRMKARCYNPNHAGYENYGGLGITVCDEWVDNAEAFLQYMGKRPTKKSLVRQNKR